MNNEKIGMVSFFNTYLKTYFPTQLLKNNSGKTKIEELRENFSKQCVINNRERRLILIVSTFFSLTITIF